MIKITLDMMIPSYPEPWTLAEAFASIKRQKMTGLLENTEEEVSEQVTLFERAVRNGESPSIGQVLAAWFVASTEVLDQAYIAEDSTMSNRSYGKRKSDINKLVFRKEYR